MKMVNAVSARFTGTNGDVSEEWYQIEDGKTSNRGHPPRRTPTPNTN
jgi:hypothetical protein